jgi:hypothetical protein
MINGNIPRDGSNEPVQDLVPAIVAIEETYDATISSSTEITLNVATKMIEVTAIDKAICMKWGTGDASTSDFDHVIPQNTTRRFAVPVETAATGALFTAVNFIEQAATAILAVSEF